MIIIIITETQSAKNKYLASMHEVTKTKIGATARGFKNYIFIQYKNYAAYQ